MSGLEVRQLNIDAVTSCGISNIVDGLSFDVEIGQTLAIVGESGGGKTMTALSLVGLLPDNCKAQGQVMLNGVDLLQLTEKQLRALRGTVVQYLPQSGQEYLNPSEKIGRQILSTVKGRQNRQAVKAQALQLLESYGLPQPLRIWQSYPHNLSGGQAQRVVLAMTALTRPQLVIADEPTKGVGSAWAKHWIEDIRNIFGQSMVIVITHDMEVASCADNILVMYNGQLMQYGASNVVLQGGHPYTDNLIKALPVNGMVVNNQNNDKIYTGCRYSARCPMASQRCEQAKSSLTPNGDIRRCVL